MTSDERTDLAALRIDPRGEERTELSGPHPLDGAIVVSLSPAVAEELAMEGAWFGVAVTTVRSGRLAARIGFEPGDVILAVNDRQIDTVGALKAALTQDVASWQITFRRDGKIEAVTIR